jgi:hypothetical protein
LDFTVYTGNPLLKFFVNVSDKKDLSDAFTVVPFRLSFGGETGPYSTKNIAIIVHPTSPLYNPLVYIYLVENDSSLTNKFP